MADMRARRTVAFLASATLLASLTVASVAAPVAAAPGCTYRMTQELADYDASGDTVNVAPVTAGPGDVICGGPGRDAVGRMDGGTFRGRGGRDVLKFLGSGKFYGGPGADTVFALSGGVFRGGAGDDFVFEQRAGLFRGDRGKDSVGDLAGGTFRGGAGSDRADSMDGGRFFGGPWRDSVGNFSEGTFYGARGDDMVEHQSGGSTFYGGPGSDFSAACGGLQFAVETIVSDC